MIRSFTNLSRNFTISSLIRVKRNWKSSWNMQMCGKMSTQMYFMMFVVSVMYASAKQLHPTACCCYATGIRVQWSCVHGLENLEWSIHIALDWCLVMVQCICSSIRVDSPTVGKPNVCLTIATAASKGWQIQSTDVKSAFLQGDPPDRDMFVIPHVKASASDSYVWKLKKT